MRNVSKSNITLILAAAMAAISLTVILLQAGCGSSSSAADTINPAAANASAEDKAAKLAAQVQLRNAQMAQESYYSQHQNYAPTIDVLKAANPALNVKVEVVSGDATSFEMRVTANDSAHTVYIIRKNGSDIARVDGNDNPW